MCLLHFFDLFQSSDIALAAVETCREEPAHELRGDRGAHHLTTQAEHVHVVVLDALVRGVGVVADRGADPGELARRKRRADARAADEHASLGVAGTDRFADLPRLVRIVDPDAAVVGAEIDDFVAQGADLLQHGLAQFHAPVIERSSNAHQSYVTPLPIRRLRPMSVQPQVGTLNDAELWRELGQQLRVDSIRCAAVPKSGHPTSSMSAADLMAVLLAKYLRYDFDQPDDPRNDHLIFSKGHASPLLYSIYKAAGAVSDEELRTFRKFGARLEGHPTPKIPWVDVATGSLGQGLPIAVGVALAGKKLDRLPYRVWCVCGDSELAEGSMWEAFEHAAFAGLDNLVAVLDVNRLGQRGETMHGWDLSSYTRRAEACGWAAIEIDGHDVEAIDRAYEEAIATTGRPTAIVARTLKGKGVRAVEELGGERHLAVDVAKPDGAAEPHEFPTEPVALPAYELGKDVATRKAY